MLANILVPLDGSALSELALPYAEALGRRTGATLTLVRAVSGAPPALVDAARFQLEALATAEDYLAALRAPLTERGVNVRTGVPFGGSPASWIVEEIEL